MAAMRKIASIPFLEGESAVLHVSEEEILPSGEFVTVTDKNIVEFFAPADSNRMLKMPPGETAKAWTSVEKILNFALSLSLGRDGMMLGFGGGVVCDVTAFAASIYMRGCRLVLVPTTLLSMVDAAIGGKTGINFGGSKNILGTFYPANEVRICPKLLRTLPDWEYKSGLAEVIKHAMLEPKKYGLLDILLSRREAILSRDSRILNRIIPAAAKIKADIVSADLREQGRRAYLNLGHTFGHALEGATNFIRWSHGEAVAWGIKKALDLGERMGITNPDWAKFSRRLFSEYGFDDVNLEVESSKLKEAMIHDKKKQGGELRFILMRDAGEVTVEKVNQFDLDSVLEIRNG
ncbi:3-dehydroquinate synthase [Olavius algarvensis spirochete endosymbiont]|nr:3-dehydroquinate synthase [Olavius algarvensis spirochete endosymbiont]